MAHGFLQSFNPNITVCSAGTQASGKLNEKAVAVMKEIGIDVNVPIDEYHQRLTAASSNQEHLAIVITFGGRGILSDILPRILTKTKTPSF